MGDAVIRCSVCAVQKPLTEFQRYRAKPRKLRPDCRSCARKDVGRRFYQRNAEDYKSYGQAYRARPEVVADRAEKARVYRLKMRPALRAKLQKWRADNPEAARLQNIESAHIRRCRRAGVTVERFNRDAIFVRDRGLCAYCGLGLDPLCWHLDHVQPIARGGGHTRANVVASCPTCNMRKGAREVSA